MTDKQELLQKIQALAKSGCAGEKENAELLLKKLMKKYNISEQDIELDKIIAFRFTYKNQFEEKLAHQIAYSIYGNINSEKLIYTNRKQGEIWCTNAEFLEFDAKFAFYKTCLQKDLSMFYNDKNKKNNIFPPDNLIQKDENNELDLTDDDLYMLKIAKSLNKYDYLKQITD